MLEFESRLDEPGLLELRSDELPPVDPLRDDPLPDDPVLEEPLRDEPRLSDREGSLIPLPREVFDALRDESLRSSRWLPWRSAMFIPPYT